MLKWKIRVRRRREVREKGEKDVRRENRLAQRREREGKEGRRRTGQGDKQRRQPCLFSESGDTSLALSLALSIYLER